MDDLDLWQMGFRGRPETETPLAILMITCDKAWKYDHPSQPQYSCGPPMVVLYLNG